MSANPFFRKCPVISVLASGWELKLGSLFVILKHASLGANNDLWPSYTWVDKAPPMRCLQTCYHQMSISRLSLACDTTSTTFQKYIESRTFWQYLGGRCGCSHSTMFAESHGISCTQDLRDSLEIWCHCENFALVIGMSVSLSR